MEYKCPVTLWIFSWVSLSQQKGPLFYCNNSPLFLCLCNDIDIILIYWRQVIWLIDNFLQITAWMFHFHYYYRPQRSCGQGHVFTGVCLSTGGEGVCLSACWDAIPPPAWRAPPGWRTPPGWKTAPPGWRTPPDEEPPPEADSSIRSTSGRYASYWNAFLLLVAL